MHASLPGTTRRWMLESQNDDAKELDAVMQCKSSRHKQLAVVPGFRCTDDAVLRKCGPQQIRQMLRPSMEASACMSKDRRIKELVTFLLRDHMVSVGLVSARRFTQLILELNRRKTESSFVDMATPTIFEVSSSSHSFSLFNDGLQNKKPTVPQDYRAGTLVGFCAQHMLEAWKETFSRSQFTKLLNSWLPLCY